MKKSLFMVLFLFFAFMFGGCYNYSRGAEIVQLVSIQYFTEDGIEIEGEFVNIYEYNRATPTRYQPTNKMFVPMNSPAPIDLHYYATVEEGAIITIRLTIVMGMQVSFNAIYIQNVKMEAADFQKAELNNRVLTLEYQLPPVTEDALSYKIDTLYVNKTINGEDKILQGTTWVEGRAFIRGFFFELLKEEEATSNPLDA